MFQIQKNIFDTKKNAVRMLYVERISIGNLFLLIFKRKKKCFGESKEISW